MDGKGGEPHRKSGSGVSNDVLASRVSYSSGGPVRLWQGDSIAASVSVDGCLGCHDVSDAVCGTCLRNKHRKTGLRNH